MFKRLELYDKINDLEVENIRLKQTINFKNRKIEDLKELEDDNLELKCKVYYLEVNLNTLEAELTYWKETAEYWKDVAFEFERHNKYLKELNKTFDK